MQKLDIMAMFYQQTINDTHVVRSYVYMDASEQAGYNYSVMRCDELRCPLVFAALRWESMRAEIEPDLLQEW